MAPAAEAGTDERILAEEKPPQEFLMGHSL